MDATDVIAKALEINAGLVGRALEGLTDEDLATQPSPDCNPPGWLVWHQTRTEDAILSTVTGEPQLWISGKWHERFGLPPDPANGGIGHKMDQVRAFRSTKQDLADYAAAVRKNTLAVLGALGPADLDKEVPSPLGGTVPAGELLGILMADHFHHSGQICYLRGYISGFGWFPM